MANKSLLFLVGLSLALLTSCGVSHTWYNKFNKNWEDNYVGEDARLTHSVFLLGDAGKPDLSVEGRQDPVLRLLQHKLLGDSLHPEIPTSARTLVLLGDNIYEAGLPPEDASDREVAQMRLTAQLDVVKGTDVNMVVVPGNHDWQRMRPEGSEYVVREQRFVDDYLDDPNAFQPKGGCPGPVAIELDQQTTLIAIDSEWWLTQHLRPDGNSSPCGIQDEGDFLVALREVIEQNKGKHMVVVFHHPLITNGNHGGHFSLKDHIFPLTLLRENLYIPLPVIGSIYPMMRKYGISPEDIPNPRYQRFVKGMTAVLANSPNTIVAVGHDHNLQLHQKKGLNHIVSGAGAKQNFVVPGKGASFVGHEKGFACINYYENGEVWVEFWTPSEDNPEGTLLYRGPVYAMPPSVNPEVIKADIPNYQDSTIVLAAGEEYKSRFFLRNFLMGKAYRKVWGTPVKLRYLDMKYDKGGLSPIKMGGGMQTLSLRVAAGEGNQYTLRSINKDPSGILPEGMRKTFLEDVFQDGMATANPYGALVVPKLADAADVYHTSPGIRFIPYTPSLGQYLDEFGGMMALMEIRPDEDLSEFRRFGRSENVVGTDKLLEQLREDNDNALDQTDMLRARALDLLVGDWDRHTDQWRWAEFDRDSVKGELYRPVPRDRDQAFVQFNGVITAIAASPFLQRRLSNFGYKIRDLAGLMESGKNMDRQFLAGLDREAWRKEAEFLQASITDTAIEAAVRDLPPEVYPLIGDELVGKLKQRRDDLAAYLDKYYLQLAAQVDVVLTDKNEYVHVQRMQNGDTRVMAYKRDLDPGDKEIEHVVFDRLFKADETNEIRVYCLDGQDSVLVEGEAAKGIFTRLITGKGADVVVDKSRIRGLRKHTQVLDDARVEGEDRFETLRETKVDSVSQYKEYAYDLENYEPNVGSIVISVQYDQDFGLYLGGGFRSKTYGFKSHPFKSEVRAMANHSLVTNSFNFEFSGEFPSLFNYQTGLKVDAEANGPRFVRNFFGYSNESTFEEGQDIQANRIGLNYYVLQSLFTRRVGGNTIFELGPLGEYATVYQAEDGVALDTAVSSIVSSDPEYTYVGAKGGFRIDLTDVQRRPTRGLTWNGSVTYLNNVRETDNQFINLKSEATFYATPNFPFEMTFALRLGAETNVGDFPFYRAAFLGGVTNLRGHVRQRFVGQSALYQNLELRLKFAHFNSYLMNGKIGAYGFLDNGRVFAKGETSRVWHQGYGGGLWLDLFDLFVVSGSIGFSEEGRYFRLNSGFFF